MTFPRPRFTIAGLLGVTALAAIGIFVATYPARKRARTIATYDDQKHVVNDSVKDFVDALTKDGLDVVNDSSAAGGSGEWRHYVAVTATDEQGTQEVCYVEIMGFVTHDKNDQPTWMDILPMRISHRGRKLNERYLGILIGKLRDHGWQYVTDSQCRGHGGFSTFGSDHYLARD